MCFIIVESDIGVRLIKAFDLNYLFALFTSISVNYLFFTESKPYTVNSILLIGNIFEILLEFWERD